MNAGEYQHHIMYHVYKPDPEPNQLWAGAGTFNPTDSRFKFKSANLTYTTFQVLLNLDF